MFEAAKPLLVVLAVALVIFALAKPVCMRFMLIEDFTRRRNVWFAITCAGFLAPTFWVFAGVALPLLYWATSKDRHPAALYLMLLLTVPPVSLPIPLALVNKLFDLTTYRILALGVLIPAAARLASQGEGRRPGLAKADLVVLAYGLLQLALYMPYESATNTLRRAFLFGLDTYVLYYVFSRGTATRPAMLDTLSSFALACAVLAPITAFEAVKGWLLFGSVGARWGVPDAFGWLFRGDSLRAQASAGHSLTMGYLLAVALGFWFYLGNQLQSRKRLWMIGGLFGVGLLGTGSRAPLLTAGVILLLFLVLAPSGRKGLFATLGGMALLAIPFSFTPAGQRVIDTLPFIGTQEQFNVDYRQQLAEVSWRLIQQKPFFGDPFAMDSMEELRQGQGIIDIVNTYAGVSLFYGLVGCALFVGCFAYPMYRSFVAKLAAESTDREDADLGGALVACLLGTLVFMATASLGTGFEILAWTLAGLCSAYPAIAGQVAPSGWSPPPVTQHYTNPTVGRRRSPLS